ncbi:MAG: substrate-binding domain-containing protein [Lachnospiraceae bacterium]|nr:substrate-binding domain-containing protein [Lachnospiraceae bacterium]
MATIKDVAAKAGVSRGTVDRVLNHRGNVNPETEQRILEVMKALNFTPNKAGMALAAQKKKYCIGIILFSKKNPFFDQVLEGMQDKSQELAFYGCSVYVQRVAYDPHAQLSAIEACKKHSVDGLILTPYNDPRIHKEINALTESGIPVMTVNSDIEHTSRLCYVGSDYYQSGQAAASLMEKLTQGPVRLGIINGDLKILCHKQRMAGFTDYLKGNERFKLMDRGDNFDDDLRSQILVESMLEKHPEINALFFTAAGVYGGCKAVQKIMEETNRHFTIITFDEVPTTIELIRKGIVSATICQEPYWQGARSLELMFRKLSEEDFTPEDSYYGKLSVQIKETI